MIEEKKTTYPTKPGADGFYFENSEEQAIGVETKVYDNGNLVKRAKLSNGKVAVIRELLGKDNKDIFKTIGDKSDGFLNASIACATKIDDQPVLMEDIDFMKMKDVNKLTAMHQALNF